MGNFSKKNLSGLWPRPSWWGTAVLLFMYALALTSLASLAPTFDEQGFIIRGLGYLRGENRHMRVGHPLGLNALNAAALAHDSSVQLPSGDPSWQQTGFHRPAELFLWEMGNNVEHIMFLARLPTIWLGLLLAALVGRWAWRLTGSRWAGLLALALIALDPNILANMSLATTDLGFALAAALAGFTLWRYWIRPSWPAAALAGVAFALLQNTKFTAGLFVPLFALVMATGALVWWRHGRRFPWRPAGVLIVIYPLFAFFTLWALYGFQIGALPTSLPSLPQLAGVTIPLSHHVEQLLDIGARLQAETPSFLMGQYSNTGWWYYFPVAFALKTPLITLLLLAAAFILRLTAHGPRITDYELRATDHGPWATTFNNAALLIPSLGYFAFALTSEINLGYRHLLPLLPFTAVFIANTLATAPGPQITHYVLRFTLYTVVPVLSLLALWLHPHYLSYFNVLAGGPDGGWRYLVDSNIDWGQDLGALKAWMDENEVAEVWLSYFGEARPAYYGIPYKGLDSWPPRLMNPEARPYYPHHPAPGIYAISATNLQGVHFANHDQFAWFRNREPIAKIGYSIFLYEAPAQGGPVDVVLAGMQLDEISAPDFARFNSNHVSPRWVDPEAAIIIPDSARRWLVLAKETAVSPTITALIQSWPLHVDREHYAIYQTPPLTLPVLEPVALFSLANGAVGLIDAHVGTAVAGHTLPINSAWQQKSSPQPINIFIHILDSQENIVAQWDGLGAAWEGWQPGDALLLTHAIPLPADLPAGAYQIRSGVYNPHNGQRWLTQAGTDYVALGKIEIGKAPITGEGD